MNLFRIAKQKFARDISGTGAKLFGGRWNPAGKAVVYTAGSSALCLLEHLTHLSRTDLGLTFQLILIETYNTPITFLEDYFPLLPAHWKNEQELTREYGKLWLEKQYSPILLLFYVYLPCIHPGNTTICSTRIILNWMWILLMLLTIFMMLFSLIKNSF